VENVTGKDEISLGALYSQFLAAEVRLDLHNSQQYQSSVNSTSCGHGCGDRGGFDRGEPRSSSGTKPVCQLCNKTGDTVQWCWKCFDRNFIDEEKTTNITKGPKYNVDPTWYSDTGATDHITSELDKLAVREKYNGQEQIHVANDGGMHIAHVGHSTLYTPSRNLALKSILHVPSSQRNLIFIHHFTRDNHVFIEYHPYVFLVKDPFMRKVLLHGKCRGGLYPFPSLEKSTTKCALSVVKPSNRRCHERLGHPSLVVFQRVLGDNKLAYSRDPHPEAVCDECQCAKSHQLSFPRSLSVSKALLVCQKLLLSLFIQMCGDLLLILLARIIIM
jgi:hypothetical protein